jgi:hypothetical protein
MITPELVVPVAVVPVPTVVPVEVVPEPVSVDPVPESSAKAAENVAHTSEVAARIASNVFFVFIVKKINK